MGRPTDLTPELQKRICDAVLAGMHLSPAAEACGVPSHTALEWLRRGEGRQRNRPAYATYATFAAAVREAEAQAERSAVVYWHAQIPDNWQAARDFLARRFPDRWANRDKLDVGGSGKEIIFRVIYGDPGSTEKPRRADGKAPQAPPEASGIPGERG